MGHTNGHTNGDASQARIEEMQRHIRVLEHQLEGADMGGYVEAAHYEISRLAKDNRERHEKLLGVLTDMLDLQRRMTDSFGLLLAGLQLAHPPPPPPAPPPPQPRKVVKPKRKASRRVQ